MAKLTRFLFPITLSGIGDTPDEAWQDAVESFSLDSGPCPELFNKEVDSDDEIPQGEPVPIPEYQINYYPVAYINVDDSGLLDQIEGMLNSCATGDGQFLVSREYLDEQIKSMEEGREIEENEKEAFDFLVKITTKLKNFGGDVWFYAN